MSRTLPRATASRAERPALIVGGGVAGLALGWRLLCAGRAVHLFERDRAGRGASWAAAGMLAPDAEIGFEDPELYRLNRESLRRWPSFAAALKAESEVETGFREGGALHVAPDRDAAEALRRRYDFMKAQGLDVQWLSTAEALDIEPFITSRPAAVLYSPTDSQVDARALVNALRAAFLKAGGVLREGMSVRAVEPDAEAPAVVTEDGERVAGSCVALAMGAWSHGLQGLTPDRQPPVRPVRGQMIELQVAPPFGLQHVVRSAHTYAAPKPGGRVLVGATMEEMGFDARVTAGGLYAMLEEIRKIVPGVDDLPVRDLWAGLRPASRDHLPILGPSSAPGVVMATGFFRHGMLLAPVASEEVARYILTGETSAWIAPFLPERFEAAPA